MVNSEGCKRPSSQVLSIHVPSNSMNIWRSSTHEERNVIKGNRTTNATSVKATLHEYCICLYSTKLIRRNGRQWTTTWLLSKPLIYGALYRWIYTYIINISISKSRSTSWSGFHCNYILREYRGYTGCPNYKFHQDGNSKIELFPKKILSDQ